MNEFWQNHLRACSAVFEHQQVMHFSTPEQEWAAAKTGTVLTDLSHLGLIGFSGEDTQTFLQGQLTSDVRQVNADRAQYSSHCTPKGRMLANFLLWQNAGGDYLMQLPAELQGGTQKRLGMFVLRSKVKVRDAADEVVRIGLAGSGAEALLQEHFHALPDDLMGMANTDTMSLLRLSAERFQINVQPEHAAALWDTLKQGSTPVGAGVWQWLEIRAGIPTITAATQEHFVPQMVNYERIGGVNFKKGCYPGQEIVARTQYLGKLKRHMYLAHVATPGVPAAGDELYSADMEGQASGMIVNAERSPDGGFDVLAVIQISSAEASPVHWKTSDGPVLELLPLPY
jgi:folate-binding protein YgfZ